MSEIYNLERVVTITPDDTERTVFSKDGSQVYSEGTCDFENASPTVTRGATAAWLRDSRVKMPMKIYKAGAAATNEYLATSINPTTGDITLDRAYGEATAAGASYVLCTFEPISKYIVKNDLTGSKDMTVKEVYADGTESPAITVLANDIFQSPGRVAVVGLRYARVTDNGSAQVSFWGIK